MSLRARIFAGSFVLVLLTIAALGVPLLIIVRDHALDEIESTLKGDAYRTASLLVTPLERGDRSAVAATAAGVATQTKSRVTVTDAAGHLVFDSDDPARSSDDFSNRPEIQTALAGLDVAEIRRSETLGTEILVIAVPAARGGSVAGAIRLSRDIANVRADQLKTTVGVVALLGLLAGVGAWISSIVSRSVGKPVAEIAGVAEQIGHGKYSARAREIGPPEIRGLARSLNSSAARVEAAVETERTFVGNAAHQLKTPLAAIGIRLDSFAGKASLEDDARSDLVAARDEVRGLGHLVDQLLALSRTSGDSTLIDEPSDPGPALRALGSEWREHMADEGIDLDVSIAADLPEVSLAPDLLAEACENLLDNVVRYCPDSDSAEFAASFDNDHVVIRVADRGPGIDPSVKEAVFDRFKRGSSHIPGTGLGMSLVKQVAESAGGSVELDTSSRGTAVTIRIPPAAAPLTSL